MRISRLPGNPFPFVILILLSVVTGAAAQVETDPSLEPPDTTTTTAPPIILPEYDWCYVWSDPYIYTFDNVFYMWHRRCVYSLTQLGNGMIPAFAVYMDFVSCGFWFWGLVSCPGPLEIHNNGNIVRVDPVNLNVLDVNGGNMATPGAPAFIAGNIVATRRFACVVIGLIPWEVIIIVCRRMVVIRVPKALSGRLGGLCGNFDGIRMNDFTARDGTQFPVPLGNTFPPTVPDPDFPNSWQKDPACTDFWHDMFLMRAASGPTTTERPPEHNRCEGNTTAADEVNDFCDQEEGSPSFTEEFNEVQQTSCRNDMCSLKNSSHMEAWAQERSTMLSEMERSTTDETYLEDIVRVMESSPEPGVVKKRRRTIWIEVSQTVG